MLLLLAQATADALVLDWKHLVLLMLLPVAGAVGNWIATRGVKLLEDKLKATGHPQAAEAFDLLASAAAKAFTDAEKQALAKAAADAGVDHPAISAATKP